MDNKNFYNVADDFIVRNSSFKTLAKTAFIDDNKSISYENLFNNIKSFAYSLHKIGLKKNNRILIIFILCLNIHDYY